MKYRTILDTCDVHTLPDLDVAVLGALELFSEVVLPSVDRTQFIHPLILGSGNAETVGRLLLKEHDAIYANESTYTSKLRNARNGIRNAVVISASGGKHAPGITEDLKCRGVTTWLLTNNPDAPARALVDEERTFVFPKNREPYTYNTSTYMGMLMGATGEDPNAIRTFIEAEVEPRVPDTLNKYNAFFLIVPPAFGIMRPMFTTKFDELFGPKLVGRSFTYEQTKHAKTVVSSSSELFISFGEENKVFGDPGSRLHIPLPNDIGDAGMMAIGYYVIGQIQKQHPPYFKNHIHEYVQSAEVLFDQKMHVIVE